jgi:hypothetical protein
MAQQFPQKRDGLIPMSNGKNDPTRPLSISKTLKRWLPILAETFTSKSLSEPQISAYIMALEDLSEHELEMGFRRALRHWSYTTMPPPAFIREMVVAALEEERAHTNAMRQEKLRNFEVPQRRLTVDEAWADWEEVNRIQAEARAKLGVLEATKRQELKKTYDKDLVLYTPERLAELRAQFELVKEKYGEGQTVRVRDSVSPEANQGTSGTERDTEKSSGEGTHNGASDK